MDILIDAIEKKRSGESRRDDGHLIDFSRITAAGKVVDRGVQTLQNRAVSREAAEALGDLVADVAGLDLGEDEGVGIARDLAAGELQLADDRETAASNCISPSIATSGAFSFAMAVALRTRSTLAPLPEPLVE